MKRFFVLPVVTCFLSLGITAQGIYQYWGTATQGGNENQGVIYTTKMNGTGQKLRPGPSVINPGTYPERHKPVVYNNLLYSVIYAGGIDNNGIIIAYDPANNTCSKVADLYTIGGNTPTGSLLLYNNKLYGTTSLGGLNNEGILFEFDPTGNSLVKLYDFEVATGANPSGDLLLSGTNIYGIATKGGANFTGVIYTYDLALNSYSKKWDFLEITGYFPYAGLVESGGLFYGVTLAGGANNAGVLYEFNPNTNSYFVRTVFGGTSGETPYASLSLYNGKFYGQTSAGGNNNGGTLFEFDPVSKLFSVKVHYTASGGTNGQGGLTVYNNKLYGLLRAGGTDNDGTLFEYDPATTIFTKKVDCSPGSGIRGVSTMTVYNNKLYGFTSAGGIEGTSNDGGVLFEYNPAINGYSKKIEFRKNTGLAPEGSVTYYNGKIYGVSSNGGDNGRGVLFSYDMATYTYSIHYHFDNASGFPYNQESMLVYNNKLYGVLELAAANGSGSLFEFDPSTNIFTKLYDFESSTGDDPRGHLVLHNNKFLGTALNGATGGAIYEFDPATNIYTPKVYGSDIRGTQFSGGLTEYNGKFYGMAYLNGANEMGTLYEYNPVSNAFTVKHDFDDATGHHPLGSLTVANNKLYGLTSQGGAIGAGVLFEYDPASSIYTKKVDLGGNKGAAPSSTMSYNEETGKLYAVTDIGGDTYGAGVLFEYDPLTNDFQSRIIFNPTTGKRAENVKLAQVPAIVAPGSPGNCAAGGSANIDNSNNNQWIAFTNSFGDAVAEINANGNNLGRVLVDFYVHNGSTRTDQNGNLFLDRNITITVDNQPASPVSVRLYIRKTEFDALKNTPNSGVTNPSDIVVYKNGGPCQATIGNGLQQLFPLPGTWGGDLVYSTTVTSFSTFYFAKRDITVLPVHILSFSGAVETTGNKLEWRASCTDATDFTVERSADGIQFTAIGTIHATAQDCSFPFSFLDQQFLSKAYYRLKMKEEFSPAKYSSILMLQRDKKVTTGIRFAPNPVTGTTLGLQITTAKQTEFDFAITNIAGQVLLRKKIMVPPGVSYLSLPARNLPPGLYLLKFEEGGETRVSRFVKQ